MLGNRRQGEIKCVASAFIRPDCQPRPRVITASGDGDERKVTESAKAIEPPGYLPQSGRGMSPIGRWPGLGVHSTELVQVSETKACMLDRPAEPMAVIRAQQ